MNGNVLRTLYTYKRSDVYTLLLNSGEIITPVHIDITNNVPAMNSLIYVWWDDPKWNGWIDVDQIAMISQGWSRR